MLSKTTKRVIFCLFLSVLVTAIFTFSAIAYYFYSFRQRVFQYNDAFQSVQLLDTHQAVVQKMGQPAFVDYDVRFSKSSEELTKIYEEYAGLENFTCDHEYKYIVGRPTVDITWVIVFDKENNVVCKYRLD